MESPDYQRKYSYYYPLMGLLFFYTLFVMLVLSLEQNFKIIGINIPLLIIVFLFILEGIIRSQASLKLELPYFLFLIEAAIFLLALRFLPLGLSTLEIILIFVISLIIWLQMIEFCLNLNHFKQDSKKIYDREKEGKEAKFSYEDFRKLLDYPRVWKKIRDNLLILNLPLILIWIISEINLYFILATIRFLILEMLILSFLYLDKLKLDWQIKGFKKEQKTVSYWNKYLILILLLAMGTAFILPYNYSPLPLNQISNWLNSRFQDMDFQAPEMGNSRDIPRPQELGEAVSEEEGTPVFLYLLAFIKAILIFSMVMAVLAFIFFIINLEFSKVGSLKEFFYSFIKFLLYFLKNIFSSSMNIKAGLKDFREFINLSQKAAKKESKAADFNEADLPEDISLLTITLYKAMLKLLALKGEKKKRYQTAYEFSQELEEKKIKNNQEINLLSRLYVETSYSQKRSKKQRRQLLKELWQKIRNSLLS